MEIQEWIKNIKTIEGEENEVGYNCWHKSKLALRINGNVAYCENPSTKEEKVTLEGRLKLEGELSKLEYLVIVKTNITGLDLSGCSDLRQITVENNPFLISVDFLTHLPNPQNLVHLLIENNNFADNTLDFLKPFVNLELLKIGTHMSSMESEEVKELIKRGTYNKFSGSLEPLKGLKKLVILSIDNTDIDSGLEYLNGEIEWSYFHCRNRLRPDAKSGKFQVEKDKYEPLSKIGLKQEKTVKNQTGKSAKALRWLGFLGLVLIGLLIVYRFLCKEKVKTQPSATQIKK